MFDVDSKDPKVGLSSPPKPFVTPEFLETVKKCLCHSHGKHKGPFICISNLKIHLTIRTSSTETAAPALP